MQNEKWNELTVILTVRLHPFSIFPILMSMLNVLWKFTLLSGTSSSVTADLSWTSSSGASRHLRREVSDMKRLHDSTLKTEIVI